MSVVGAQSSSPARRLSLGTGVTDTDGYSGRVGMGVGRTACSAPDES